MGCKWVSSEVIKKKWLEENKNKTVTGKEIGGGEERARKVRNYRNGEKY